MFVENYFSGFAPSVFGLCVKILIKSIMTTATAIMPNMVIIILIYAEKNKHNKKIIPLATKLPKITASTALGYLILRMDATAHPVHTPVRGRGIATKINTPKTFFHSAHTKSVKMFQQDL